LAPLSRLCFRASLGQLSTPTYTGRCLPLRLRPSVSEGPSATNPSNWATNPSILSSQFLQANDLRKFETFDKLIDHERKVTESVETLERSVDSITTWNKQHGLDADDLDSAPSALAASAISSHPFVADDAATRMMLIMADEGDLGSPPVELGKVIQSKKLFDVAETPGKDGPSLILFVGNRKIGIGLNQLSATGKAETQLFFQSIAHGAARNILYYETVFKSHANDQISAGRKLQQSLRSILLPNSCLSVTLALRNDGKTSITLRPYFGMRILHSDYKGKPIVMATEPADAGQNPFSLASGGFNISIPTKDVEGKNVYVKRFLPETSSSSYINIPPGELRTVTLVGIDPLGSDADTIRRIHADQLLTCQVVGITSSGKEVWSDPAQFSAEIFKDEKEGLLKVAAK